MTGYLPYLIEKHGYSEQLVIRWIENQLKRYSKVFVTSNMDEFNIIVIRRNASSVYNEKFIQVLGVPADFELVDYNDRFTIDVLRGNGVNFDLVTDVQPLNVHSIKINLGMNNDRFQKWYSVYYVKFNLSPLGDDENDVVRYLILWKKQSK